MFLLRHEENVRTELVQNTFLSGGFSKQRMMSNRIEFEIRQLLPVHSKIRVVTEKDYLFDAWNGAASVSCVSVKTLERWSHTHTHTGTQHPIASSSSLDRDMFMEWFRFGLRRRVHLFV